MSCVIQITTVTFSSIKLLCYFQAKHTGSHPTYNIFLNYKF